MTQYLPYFLALLGAYLILLAVIVRATGGAFVVLAKVVPVLFGVAALWISATILAGGA